MAKLFHDGLWQDLSSIGVMPARTAADRQGTAAQLTPSIRPSVEPGGGGGVAGSGDAGGRAVEQGIADRGRSDGANADSGLASVVAFSVLLFWMGLRRRLGRRAILLDFPQARSFHMR